MNADLTPDHVAHYREGLRILGRGGRTGNDAAYADKVFDAHPQSRSARAVAAPVAVGSASSHNGLCIHRGGPNMTPAPRRATTCAYMPDGATFNGRQTDEQVAQLAVGDEPAT